MDTRFQILSALAIIFLGTGVVVRIISLIVSYFMSKRNAIPIKFRHFKVLYEVSPGSWQLDEDNVRYNYETKFHFSIFGLLQYNRWRAIKESMKKRESDNERLAACIESWQRDISLYKKRNPGITEGWNKDDD